MPLTQAHRPRSYLRLQGPKLDSPSKKRPHTAPPSRLIKQAPSPYYFRPASHPDSCKDSRPPYLTPPSQPAIPEISQTCPLPTLITSASLAVLRALSDRLLSNTGLVRQSADLRPKRPTPGCEPVAAVTIDKPEAYPPHDLA